MTPEYLMRQTADGLLQLYGSPVSCTALPRQHHVLFGGMLAFSTQRVMALESTPAVQRVSEIRATIWRICSTGVAGLRSLENRRRERVRISI